MLVRFQLGIPYWNLKLKLALFSLFKLLLEINVFLSFFNKLDNFEKLVAKYNALITQIDKLLSKTNSDTKKFLLEYIKECYIL